MVKSQLNGQRNILTMKTELEVWEIIEYPQLIFIFMALIQAKRLSYSLVHFQNTKIVETYRSWNPKFNVEVYLQIIYFSRATFVLVTLSDLETRSVT